MFKRKENVMQEAIFQGKACNTIHLELCIDLAKIPTAPQTQHLSCRSRLHEISICRRRNPAVVAASYEAFAFPESQVISQTRADFCHPAIVISSLETTPWLRPPIAMI